MYRVSFDTAEKAATPMHDCGVFHMTVSEDKVLETVENLAKIGFTAKVEMA